MQFHSLIFILGEEFCPSQSGMTLFKMYIFITIIVCFCVHDVCTGACARLHRCMSAQVHVHVCTGARMEVRRHLCGVVSFLPSYHAWVPGNEFGSLDSCGHLRAELSYLLRNDFTHFGLPRTS